MDRIEGKIQVVQNIGLADRLIRFFGGGALLSWGALSLVMESTPVLATLAILLAVYPLMTTVMGWDPFYQLFGTRTCSLEGGRNLAHFPMRWMPPSGMIPSRRQDMTIA